MRYGIFLLHMCVNEPFFLVGTESYQGIHKTPHLFGQPITLVSLDEKVDLGQVVLFATIFDVQ